MSGVLLLRRTLPARCLSSTRLLPPQQARRYALIGKPKATTREPTWALPSTPARTRFAPSPTGYLHLGSLRTALFNYLLAQATGGQFVIRLEDTDQARLVGDAESRLYEDLSWAGLRWDEGPDKGGDFGPYRQSMRLDLYRQHAHQLLESGHAFRCFCSREDLEFNVGQATAAGAAAHYPGTCAGIAGPESDRRAANGEPHTIRFKASATPTTAQDLVYGAYKKAEREDDFIIMKSDGFPTYHFANVVDDHFMKITHVIRGAEWLISTPKHVELYNAFGWQPPSFAHVGLLVDHQRQKLSKRDIDNIGVSVYRNHNILPGALLNYAVLLGWDPNLQNKPNLDKTGCMTLEEMKNNFTLKFTRGDIVVNLSKLKHFQSKLMRDLISGAVHDPVAVRKSIVGPIMSELEYLMKCREKGELAQFFADIGKGQSHIPEVTEDYVLEVLKAWKGPVNDFPEWVRYNAFAFFPISKPALRKSYCELEEHIRHLTVEKNPDKFVAKDIHKVILKIRNKIDEVGKGGWNEQVLGPAVKKLVEAIEYYDDGEKSLATSFGWKLLRWALLNGRSGLSVVSMMVLLGRDETMHRLRLSRKVAYALNEIQVQLRHDAGVASLSKVGAKYMGETDEQETKPGTSFSSLPKRTEEPWCVKIRVGEEGEERTVPVRSLTLRRRPLEEKQTVPVRSLTLRRRPLEEKRKAPLPVGVDKGLFVSRSPGSPEQTRLVDLEPRRQTLDKATRKSGHRRLKLDERLDERERDYAPAFWELEALRGRGGGRDGDKDGGGDGDKHGGGHGGRHGGGHGGRHGGGHGGEKRAHWASPAFPRPPRPTPVPSTPAPAGEPGKLGPFLPGSPIPDLRAHLEHVQVLNSKKRRDKKDSGEGSRAKPRPFWTGPMSAEETPGGEDRKAAATAKRARAHPGRGTYRLEGWGNAQQPSEASDPDLIESIERKARAAEAERQVRKAIQKEESVPRREIERKLASHRPKRKYQRAG